LKEVAVNAIPKNLIENALVERRVGRIIAKMSVQYQN
jgi:hypothetical protein